MLSTPLVVAIVATCVGALAIFVGAVAESTAALYLKGCPPRWLETVQGISGVVLLAAVPTCLVSVIVAAVSAGSFT